MTMSKVVPTIDPRFSDPAILAFPRSPCRTKPARKKGQSVYDKYQLPFFDKKRLLLWAVEPTGDHEQDFKRGVAFAIELLKSNDRTFGWEALVSWIVGDMVRAGYTEQWKDGRPMINGIVTGFARTIGRALAVGQLPVPIEYLANP
jgi:hypothetical protein